MGNIEDIRPETNWDENIKSRYGTIGRNPLIPLMLRQKWHAMLSSGRSATRISNVHTDATLSITLSSGRKAVPKITGIIALPFADLPSPNPSRPEEREPRRMLDAPVSPSRT